MDLQFFNDPALIPTAMVSRALDGGMLTYDRVASVAKGLKHRVVMPIDFSNGGDAIVADASIQSIADFKGKKVGFNPLSPSDFLLAYALQQNGMSDKDIDAVNMTPEGIPGAMASGNLPVGVTYEPNVSQILSMGGGDKFKVVYSSKDAPGLITDVLVFDEAVIAKPAAIKAMIQGYLDGLAYMQAHPEESAKIIGDVLGVSAEKPSSRWPAPTTSPCGDGQELHPRRRHPFLPWQRRDHRQAAQDNGQIPTIPDFSQTYDAQFTEALAQ